MKLQKKYNPIISGISAGVVILLLSFITLETSAGVWMLFSFGATVFITFTQHKSEIAQPKNIFFGHLLAIFIGVIFNEIFGLSFYSLGGAVGLTIILMMYLKLIHPPAASNPIIAISLDLSFDYILFPVIAGSLLIIIMSIFINKIILKKNYPSKLI